MTFKQLQDMVLDNCQELADKPDFGLTKVKSYINRGYYNFVRETRCIKLDIDITTVADQESYSSSDAANLAYVYDIYEVRFKDAASEYGDLLAPIPHKWLRDHWSTGTPDYYWVEGNDSEGDLEIGTHPICGSSGDTITVRAFIFPTAELSANADTPKVRIAWQDALVDYATYRLFDAYGHLKSEYARKADKHLSKFNMLVNDFKQHNLASQGDQFSTLTDAYSEDY